MNTTEQLSNEFSRLLSEYLGNETISKIVEINKGYTDGSCATHEFCDPNQFMIDAFLNVIEREPEIQNQDDIELINASWNMSKTKGFTLI